MAARPNNSGNSNKFSSINYNDLFDKKSNPTPTTSSSKPKSTTSPSSSYKSLLSPRGRMLLLSRPPASAPRPTHPSPLPCPDERDLISPRPLGPSPSPSPSSPSQSKPDKFVPPHLRPGFVGKEERLEEASGRPKSSSG